MNDDTVTYSIIRMWYPVTDSAGHDVTRRPRVIRRGLSLEQAQAHCRNPRTRKDGVYFDGFDVEKKKKRG